MKPLGWSPRPKICLVDSSSRPYSAVRLVARGTIEEAVLGLHAAKRALAAAVLDGTDLAASLAEALNELGHQVETAHDGAAALGVLQWFTPDIAFLDIGLPVMDGYELARRIREDQRFAATRLVAVTGYGQKRDRAQAAEAGFDAHLVKPVDIQALERMIAIGAPPPARLAALPPTSG